MIRRFTVIILMLASLTVSAVVTAAAQEFEVSSVRPSALPEAGFGIGPTRVRSTLQYDAGGLRTTNTSLRALIAEAFQLPFSLVSEADEKYKKVLDRPYDISAKSEQPASREVLREMLRALLRDRFELSFHHASKPEPVYRLVVRKGGTRIEKSNAEAENAHWVADRSKGLAYLMDATPTTFCERLKSYMGQLVLNSTSLDGLYNFPIPVNTSASDEGRDILVNGLQQFGLDLLKDRAPIDRVIVDYAAQPSAN